MGVYINGEYFNQLQFASDILLTTESSDESQEMQNDQKKWKYQCRLKIKQNKTKVTFHCNILKSA